MTNTITISVKTIAGDLMLPAEALALLFGISPELIKAHSAQNSNAGSTPMPSAWIKAGRRRASEARAATGQSDMVSSLTYWAAKDHGAELEIVYEAAS